VESRGENEENYRKAHRPEDIRGYGCLAGISRIGVLTSCTKVDLRHLIHSSFFSHNTYGPLATKDSIQINSSNLQNYEIDCPKEGKFGGKIRGGIDSILDVHD
jgi:hypothetical protein